EVMDEFYRLVTTTTDPVLHATANCIQAYGLLWNGETERAAPLVQRGFAAAAGTTDPDAGFECYRADALRAARRGDRGDATRRMNEWLASRERRGLAETRGYVATLGSLAYVFTLLNDMEQSYLTTQRSLAVRERLGMGHTVGTYVDLDRA